LFPHFNAFIERIWTDYDNDLREVSIRTFAACCVLDLGSKQL